jgi:hypothetical protein
MTLDRIRRHAIVDRWKRTLGAMALIGILVVALPSWAIAIEPIRMPTPHSLSGVYVVPPADTRSPRSEPATTEIGPAPSGRPRSNSWPYMAAREGERPVFRRQPRRLATLPAHDLRRMARDLDLDIDPDDLAGRGRSLRARDAFWAAANRAVLDAIAERDLIRLARLYGAQSAILRSEGRQFMRLLAEAHRSDLGSIDSSRVSIIAKDCDVCARDDGLTLATADELIERRLPHAECQRGHCSCMYTHGMRRDRREAAPGDDGDEAYEAMRRELATTLLEPMRAIATSARLSPPLRRTAARLLLERQERHLVDESITGLTETERLEQRRAVLEAIAVLDALVGLAGDADLSLEERQHRASDLMGEQLA